MVLSAPPPSSVAEGSPFSVTVLVEDSSGNVVTNFSGKVTVSLSANPGGSTLGGTLSSTRWPGKLPSPTSRSTRRGPVTFCSLPARACRTSPAALSPWPSARRRSWSPRSRPAAFRRRAAFGFSVAVEDSQGNIATIYSGIGDSVALFRPGRRRSWRHTHGPRRQRRGSVHRPVAQPFRQLHAAGRRQRPGQRDDQQVQRHGRYRHNVSHLDSTADQRVGRDRLHCRGCRPGRRGERGHQLQRQGHHLLVDQSHQAPRWEVR